VNEDASTPAVENRDFDWQWTIGFGSRINLRLLRDVRFVQRSGRQHPAARRDEDAAAGARAQQRPTPLRWQIFCERPRRVTAVRTDGAAGPLIRIVRRRHSRARTP